MDHESHSDEFKILASTRYAKHIRSLKMKCDAIQFDVDEMRESMTGVRGMTYGARSPRFASGDAIPNGVARLDEMIAEYTTCLVEWLDEKREAVERFKMLDATSFALLTYYYANGLTWAETGKLMNMDPAYVQRKPKRDAMIALYDVMPERWRRDFPDAI